MGDLAMVIYTTSRGKEHCTTVYASETKFRKNVNGDQNEVGLSFLGMEILSH